MVLTVYNNKKNRQYCIDGRRSTTDKDKQVKISNFWHPTHLEAIPCFFSQTNDSVTRTVTGSSVQDVASRLCRCLQKLSIQATYDNEAATASLLTPDNVAMHVALWRASHSDMATTTTCQQDDDDSNYGVLVEIMYLGGGSLQLFSHYSHCLLDAAAFEENLPMNDPVTTNTRSVSENDFSVRDACTMTLIQIAHEDLMTEMSDTVQLGLEFLCFLTDPSQSETLTAVWVAHVVLLGCLPGMKTSSAKPVSCQERICQQVRHAILRTLQESFPFNGVDVTLLLQRKLALTVLANALHVLENYQYSIPSHIRETSNKRVIEEFVRHSKNDSDEDIVSTLITDLCHAELAPTNAVLAVQCIGWLCRASDTVKRQVNEELTVRRVLPAVFHVGELHHFKLASECKNLAASLAA